MLPLAQLADIFDFELIGRIGLSSPIVGLIFGWALVGIPARRIHWRLCLWYYFVAAILWGLGVGAIAVAGASQVLAIIGCPMLLVILGGPIIGLIAATSPCRLRSRYPLGHCQSCGYNLTGNVSGRCPECGQSMSAPPAEPRVRNPKHVFWTTCGLIAILLALAGPAFHEKGLFLPVIWTVAMITCCTRAIFLSKHPKVSGQPPSQPSHLAKPADETLPPTETIQPSAIPCGSPWARGRSSS